MKKKFLSMFVSFKVYLCVTATVLLCVGKITGEIWSTVILGLAIGRVAAQGMATFKGTKLEDLEK